MTDEEIVKRAEESLEKRSGTYGYNNFSICAKPYKDGFFDGYFIGAKENAPQWHYPSKGEFPNDCETVLGYAIKNEHKMLVEIYLRDGDWQLANGMLGLEYRIIAWQYLPEPPKEE